MYSIIKSTIERGAYNLADMLTKIDTIWIQGSITDEQRTELASSAQSHAKVEYSYAPIQRQIDELAADIDDLMKRITAIEQGKPHEPPAEPDEWPEYVQPTGAHDAYYNGDKITYNGQRYICTAPLGAACVWNPDQYPLYWEKQD